MDIIFTLLLSLLTSWTQPVAEVAQPVQATTTATVTRVIDGDTIDVLLDGEIVRVRYIGVDTPEPYRDGVPACFAAEASAENERLVAGKTVSLVADSENMDQYDRLLRYVYSDGIFVNAALVQNGYATTLPIKPNTRHTALLQSLESEAAEAVRGLWDACQ